MELPTVSTLRTNAAASNHKMSYFSGWRLSYLIPKHTLKVVYEIRGTRRDKYAINTEECSQILLRIDDMTLSGVGITNLPTKTLG